MPGEPLGLSGAIIEHLLRSVPQPEVALNAFAAVAFRMHAQHVQSFSRAEFTQAVQQWLPAEAGDAAGMVDAELGTPLVTRQAGTEPTFGFVHVSLTEYLAARYVARGPAPTQTVIDMVTAATDSDVNFTAMTIGLLPAPEKAFNALAELPDSLDLAVLRLRARAMRFARGDLAVHIH